MLLKQKTPDGVFCLCAHKRATARTMTSKCETVSQPLVYCDDTTPQVPRKELNRKQLKQLLGVLIEKAKDGAFPKLPQAEYQDDS